MSFNNLFVAFRQNNLTFSVRLSEIFECMEAAARFGVLPSLGEDYFSAPLNQVDDDNDKVIIGGLDESCTSIPQEYVATGNVYPTNGLTIYSEAYLLFEFSPDGNAKNGADSNNVILPLDALVAALIMASQTEAQPNTGIMCIPALPYEWRQRVSERLLTAQYL